ncbi:hypothetical protein J2R90_003816 [Bradyrhizobium japonicum]|nr:hypothetical protein [Bradyrhizobium japonicum]
MLQDAPGAGPIHVIGRMCGLGERRIPRAPERWLRSPIAGPRMRRLLAAVFPRRALLSGLHGIAASRTTWATAGSRPPRECVGAINSRRASPKVETPIRPAIRRPLSGRAY